MMDNKDILDNEYASGVGLAVTGAIRGYLQTAANWGRFVSIVGFFVVGLMVISLLGIGSTISDLEQLMSSGFPFGSTAIVIMFSIIIAILFFPCLFLFNFSTSVLRSLQSEEQVEFEKAFHNLKRGNQFIGIVVALYLSFNVLLFLIALFA